MEDKYRNTPCRNCNENKNPCSEHNKPIELICKCGADLNNDWCCDSCGILPQDCICYISSS